MLHSHEGLDRAGGVARGGLLAPLRFRDFRLLWSGACISLLGDGAFLVALAWAVYELSDVPDGDVARRHRHDGADDRLPARRRGGERSPRPAADHARRRRGARPGGRRAGSPSLTGALELWHVVVLVVFYGTGAAFFAPAFDAIVPELVPASHLAQANALEQIVRPLAMRLAGPALGGVCVGTFGSGTAFALNAASFLVSGAALLAMRRGARKPVPAGVSVLGDLREGWRYVRSRTWLWATFASAAIAYLCFMGPVEVLLPLIVKQELGGSATDLGIVFAAGGLGSVGCALLVGRRGLPRRDITCMYVAWTLATLAVAGYGVAGAVWQLMIASLAFNALETAGTIIWATAKQRHVPGEMLGRVSSLDWLISIGLLPLSFALTGPVSAAIGPQGTMVAAGAVGAVVTLAALFLPGMRAVEGREPLRESAETPGAVSHAAA